MSMPNTSLNMLALPSYTLEPAPPLVGFVSDTTLSLVVPLLVYWVTSLFFHWLETSGWLSEYRIHTSEEEKARNTVSRWQCLRRVLLIQVIQLSVGAVLARGSEGDVTGKEDYDVVVWARRLLMLRGYVPYLLSVIGLDVWSFGNKYASYGLGFHGINFSEPMVGEKFGSWEMAVARVLFWYIVPALQYIICVFVIDTWQYFVHRFEHTNKWVYRNIHSDHHRLYVSYAYGAMYTHPLEGFYLDILGNTLGLMVAGLSNRQSIYFGAYASLKAVVDHGGYVFPWDPLRLLSKNDAAFHDVHHQSWGLKLMPEESHFAAHFTFWDWMMGTYWSDKHLTARLYEHSRAAAHSRFDAMKAGQIDAHTKDEGAPSPRIPTGDE